jgi:hypothetical protein
MGDAMAYMGDYITLLATEYYLTKKQGGDLTAIKNEIYYALKAIERVDLFAEKYLNNGIGDGELNGFILRDDAPLDFYKNWQETDNVQFLDGNRSNGFVWDERINVDGKVYYDFPPIPGDSIWFEAHDEYVYFKYANEPANYKPHPLESMNVYKWYFPTNVGSDVLTCGKIKNDTILNPGSGVKNAEMSQDQLIGALVGCAAVVKLVDDDMVVPTPQDDTAYLKSMAKVLGRRLLNYVSSTKRVYKPSIMIPYTATPDWMKVLYKFTTTSLFFDIPQEDLPFEITDELDINWILTNPIDDSAVHIGCNSWLFSYPLSEIGNKYFNPSTNYDPHLVCKTTGAIELDVFNTTLIRLIGSRMGMIGDAAADQVVYYVNHPDELWNALCLLESTDIHTRIHDINISRKDEDVTNQMICWLGAASGTLSGTNYATMVDSFSMPWFELLDCVFNRYSAQQDKFFGPYNKDRNFYKNLLSIADCSGPRKQPNADTLSPFNKPSVFSLPTVEYSTRVKGDYNGMDYMLMYNMYRMVFPDSLPAYIPNACPCNNNTTKVLETIGTGTGKYGHSLKTNVETFFRFPEYKRYSIDIPEYANHAIDVGDSLPSASLKVLKINGDLTICNNSKMQILEKGKMHLTRSVPDYQKELKVTSGSELRLNNGGTLEIENLSSLIIEKGAKLTVGQNSHIILNGSASRLIIEGEIVLDGGAELKIEWPTDSIPGTVVFKSTTVPIKVSATGNNAILNLSSLDNDHTYLEIIGQAGLEVDATVSKMIVKNTGILLDENSKIKVHCPLTVDNIEASPKYPNENKPYGAAFYIYGQKNVKISNSNFTGGMMALGGKLYNYGINMPELNYVNIDHCQWGVQLYNGGIVAKNSTFTENGIGIDLQASTIPSVIENCNFTDNYPMGILINSTSTGELNIRNSTIDGGHECITSGGAPIRPFCNLMKNTDEAIFLNDMAFLNLNATNGAGYNKIEDNYYGVYGDQYIYSNPNYMNLAGSVDFNNGYTAFRNSTLQVKMLLCNRQDFAATPAPPSDVFINSSKNYWLLNSPPPLLDSVHYLLDFKPSWLVPRANGIIQQTDDYATFSNLNIEQSNTCGWPPSAEREWPRDTMPKDCDDKTINTANFSLELLSEVYSISTKNLYEIGDKPQALVGYKDILLAPIPAPTRCQSDIYFLTKSYLNSFVAFGQIYSDTLTTDTNRIILCNEMIDLLDTLLVLANNGDTLWAAYKYTISLDKSDLLRLKGNYISSIDLLNNMIEEYSENERLLEKINYQLCINESEQAFKHGGMLENDVDSIYACHRSFESQEEYSGGGSFVQKYPAKIKEVHKPEISLMPNPADNAITIVANQLIKNIIVYDNIGKEVLKVNNTNSKSLKIDVSQLPDGIYRAYIDFGSSKSLKTFIVK